MARSESPHSISTPISTWSVSVSNVRIAPEPAPESAPDHDDEDAVGSKLPTWFPTRIEGLMGVLLGATIGALVMTAVALDLDDYTPPAAAPTRTGHFLVAGTRRIEITSPPTAPARAASSERTAPSASGPRRQARHR